MSTEKWTEKAREALIGAQREAEDRNHSQIEPEHLLLALAIQPEGVVPSVLAAAGVRPQEVATALGAELDRLPRVTGASKQTYISQRLSRIISAAEGEAKGLRDEYLSTEHLLLAMTEDTKPRQIKINVQGRQELAGSTAPRTEETGAQARETELGSEPATPEMAWQDQDQPAQ